MSNPAPHRARKRFGQNFLHDAGVINRIIQAINPQADQHLVEIGPGQGALTDQLLASGAELDVIELDRDLVARLEKRYAQTERLRLHSADALKFDFSMLVGERKLRVVGNLPYNISTPLLFHLLDQAACIQDMHFMLQKEVVQRMAAKPDQKAYGRLSVMLQLRCRIESLFDVDPACFDPAPKVTSAVVRLIPRDTLIQPVDDLQLLDRVVTQAFSQRRKTLRNALKTLCTEAAIEAAQIDPTLRAENVRVEQFVLLSNHLARSGAVITKAETDGT